MSVLIPTYNRKDLLLQRALPSVLKQSYRRIEVIVAAHGCTDGTVEAVEALGDARVRVFHVERRQTYPPTAENHWFAGPVQPLNFALRQATGDWLARIDDDDEWTPDHLETLVRHARMGDFEFVSSAYGRVRNGMPENVAHDMGRPPIGGTQTWVWRSYLRFMRWNPDCWRKSWDRVNDTDLAERFRRAGVRIGYLPSVTAWVLPRPGETTVGLAAYTEDRARTERTMGFKQPQQ